jgi:1-phosphatidylinositol-4-phosphate 5-kinase
MRGELRSFKELTSSGKSGSFFYYSANGKFILKTISKLEFSVMLKILPGYYEHIKKHPKTLLCRYYGLHKIKFKKLKETDERSTEIYFVIMNNLFETDREIDIRYDLKGSLYKRLTESSAVIRFANLAQIDSEEGYQLP